MPQILVHLALLLLAASIVSCEQKQLKSANDAIYFSKSTEIAVMGMFESKSGEEWEVFQQVISEFDKDTGIALGYTLEKAVYSRYLEDGQTPPSVIIFSSFAPETGLIQKGKKARIIFKGEFTFTELYKFVLRESQPVVLRLPENNGPDFQKRMMLAYRSGMPKVFVFEKTPAKASEALMQAAVEYHPLALTIFFSVNTDDEEDEGLNAMSQLGLKVSDIKAGPAAVISFGDREPTNLAWSGGDAKELVGAVSSFLDDMPPFEPSPGSKKAKTPVNKKKGKASKKSGEL